MTHGTPANYQREMKIEGRACHECSDANRDYTRAWRIRSRRTRALNLSVETVRALVETADPAACRALLADLVGPRTTAAVLGEPEPEEPDAL